LEQDIRKQKLTKKLRKSGDDLFFAPDSNLLWAREGESWVNLGHVVPMGPPRGIKKYSPSVTAILMEEACDYRASKIDFGVGNLVNPPSCKRVNVRAGGLGRSCRTAMIYCNDA